MPVVIFTRDIVMRAIITDQSLRPAAGGDRAGNAGRGRSSASCTGRRRPPASPFSLAPGGGGDVRLRLHQSRSLRVQRRGENEISFPGCTDFPYPLVRCPAR